MQAQRQQPLKDLAVLAGQVSRANEELLVIGYIDQRWLITEQATCEPSLTVAKGKRAPARRRPPARNKTSGATAVDTSKTVGMTTAVE